MAKKIRIYAYSGCSTCRNALKFLDARKLAYEKVPIVETPPTPAELQRMLAAYGGKIRKLFNTSGELYRSMGLGAKIDKMPESEVIDLLSTHGKLVKRPFVLSGGAAFVGFKEEDWKKVFA
jgi:Spx/MgsR family transcriptional regulator